MQIGYHGCGLVIERTFHGGSTDLDVSILQICVSQHAAPIKPLYHVYRLVQDFGNQALRDGVGEGHALVTATGLCLRVFKGPGCSPTSNRIP